MSIFTKHGDSGETSLINGCRVKKNDPRIEAYGTVDELNAVLGIARAHTKNKAINAVLKQAQHRLFTIGAELASLEAQNELIKPPRISEKDLDEMEKKIYAVEKKLPRQTSFILPNGAKSASFLHLARTVCRRAERRTVECAGFGLNPNVLKYLNRLGVLLFLFARLDNRGRAKEEAVKYK